MVGDRTYHIRTIEETRGIGSHPHNRPLQLRRMSHAAQWRVLDPRLDQFLAFSFQKLADKICLHVAGGERIDANAMRTPSNQRSDIEFVGMDTS